VSVFDLLFLCVLLGSIITLLSVVIAAMSGKWRRVSAVLRAWGIVMALYLGTAVGVRLMLPVRVLAVGDPQCSDDWCITVADAHRAGAGYALELRLTSRALRVAQREKGLVVYLMDAQGRRYDPTPDASAVPLDTLLQAGESVITTRKFGVPENPRGLDFVVTREGFGMGWLIIGRSPFVRTVVRID